MRLTSSHSTMARLGAAAVLGLATATQAAIFTVTSDTADYDMRQPSSGSGLPITVNSSSSTTVAVGARTSTRGYNGVYIFSLPVLPSGESVSTADLGATVTVSLGAGDGGDFGVDVWGIGFQSSTTAILEYLESGTDAAPGNVKIQDEFLITSTVYPNNTRLNTNASGDAALAVYLQSFYTANPGYAGGSYVFLRLNPDANPDDTADTNSGYGLASANHGTAAFRPELTIQTESIPEPAGLVLLGLAGLLMFSNRNSSRRPTQ
ncbi:MAG: PEP-CTERM sorting domain-containing protein [Phycisphaeraceae bacterium]|nr:PEP-CTERM sorting domain-containing protein [Phycisphaeraceae bacterium]